MVKSLNNKWKELLFSFSGFGPNFLMILMGAFYTDALNPAAMGANANYQVIMENVCFILPVLFPVLYTVAKIFDGIIDIPFAHITDTLSTKWGRRRPTILVCMIPMIVSYAFCWWPIGGADGQLLNTIWISFWLLVFFSTYTMCMITFYGSLSTVCSSESQRLRVSGFKSFFDTISYCVVYALVPVLLSALKINIDKFVYICMPFMLTIIIPLFLIKEGEKYGYPELQGQSGERVSIIESIRLTFKNKLFINWLIVNCCSFFGLQMFLVGMNAMIIGGMGFNGLEMAISNTCAFAPVPVMLYLFNKLKAKKGIRFTYQTCLISFAVAILSFDLASLFVVGANKPLQLAISCIGGVFGSWAIGSFFMMPYLVPAQISSVEEKLTGKNHSAMYFAAQAVTTSIVGALASALVYENIKMLFISKEKPGIIYAESYEAAAEKFGLLESQVYNLGTLLVPIIVCVMCIIGFIVAFRMPKDYSFENVAKEIKRQHPELEIDAHIAANLKEESKEEKGEIIFVQLALSILSGFIFGFVWLGFILNTLKKLVGERKTGLKWAICCFVPFASIYFLLKKHKQLVELARARGAEVIHIPAIHIILGIFFPILPINVISMCLLQKNINTVLNIEND